MPFSGCWQAICSTVSITLVIKDLQSRLKWMDEICHHKGVEHALDHICDSLNFVVVGIY
jgi:hypothetical protein